MSLAPISFHLLNADSFQEAPCAELALALFQNRSISRITDEIDHCCNQQSLFTQFASYVSKSENPLLDQKFSSYQIAPIHLAAMQQNLDAIRQLADHKVNLNAQDLHGFTACHHLAIQGNTEGLKVLESLGANCKLRTHDGATSAQLLRFSAPFRNTPEWKLQEMAVKAYHTIAPACIEEGVSIVDRSVAPPQVLTDLLWSFRSLIHPDKPNPRLNHFILEKQKEFIKNPPRLSVQQVQSDGLAPLRSCGLYAVDPIKAGDVIAYYAGELHVMVGGKDLYGKEPDKEYIFGGAIPIDAKTYRSPAAMANDGFPNACSMVLATNHGGVGGLPYQVAMIALEPIKPGEEILMDYGPRHGIKKEGHIELRKDALIRFFAKPSLNSLISKVRSSLDINTQEEAVILMNFVEKMVYLHATPGSIGLLTEEAGLNSGDLSRLQTLFVSAIQAYAAS